MHTMLHQHPGTVDRSIFGIDHLYHRSPVDPEGLLSTIPAIAHTMIGFLCCKYISIAGQTVESKIKVLKVAGLVMVALGFGLSLIGFGINKRIWSPSYVFVTCGFASWILGILVQFIDGRGAATAMGIKLRDQTFFLSLIKEMEMHM